MPLTDGERGVKKHRFNVRATERELELLSHAAEEAGVSISAFIRSSATTAAQHVLADRRYFPLSNDAWQAFVEAIAAPAMDRPRLRKLMESQTVLDDY